MLSANIVNEVNPQRILDDIGKTTLAYAVLLVFVFRLAVGGWHMLAAFCSKRASDVEPDCKRTAHDLRI